jgi:hypothetical protein
MNLHTDPWRLLLLCLCVLQAGAGGDRLASEFSAHLNQLSLKAPLQHRRPSPLDPPTAAVAAQLDALQINDWPEPDAGELPCCGNRQHLACKASKLVVTRSRAGSCFVESSCSHRWPSAAQLQQTAAACLAVAVASQLVETAVRSLSQLLVVGPQLSSPIHVRRTMSPTGPTHSCTMSAASAAAALQAFTPRWRLQSPTNASGC